MREPANPQQVAAKLAAVPHSPGVYLFRDAGANVIYVGKSLDLRQRVHAYFSKSGDERFKIVYLVAETADLEWIVTDTELEALFLENTLIKRHRPRYNVKLRDDKTYPYLRIDLRDEFPRLEMVRRYKRDGARYFGPYLSARHVTTVLRAIHRHFHIRQCEGKLDGAAPRPCMFCQIEWCRGPCAGRIARDDYGKFVRETLLLLEGKVDELTAALQQRMEEAAERLEFEVAAKLRDQIQAVQRISERQKVIDPKAEDEDIIALLDQGDMALAVVFHIRDGRLIGRSRINGLWYNTGHGSLGWTLACGSARLLSRLMDGQGPAFDFPCLTGRRH